MNRNDNQVCGRCFSGSNRAQLRDAQLIQQTHVFGYLASAAQMTSQAAAELVDARVGAGVRISCDRSQVLGSLPDSGRLKLGHDVIHAKWKFRDKALAGASHSQIKVKKVI